MVALLPLPPLAVFDLDGTLVDTAPDLTASLNHCLARRAMAPVTLDMVRPAAGHGSRAMLKLAYGRAARDLGDDELEDQVSCFLAYYEENIAVHSLPFPGVVAAMDQLAQDGCRLAICTNKSESLARHLLDSLGLSTRFAAIAGYDTFGVRKPDARHLTRTIEAAGGDPARCVMIGDTQTDIDAAVNAGIASILMAGGYDATPAARARATQVLDSFDALTPELFRKLTCERRIAT
uniref:Phosphoglycolate phosphatase n=1 Tax=Aureimonas frigidaquae TaxID=424757 RepID=A0A0P0Z2L4_9HYPH|nr:phosphoglycolate phosphatase [Aureimonas frigidaquae]